MDLTRFAGLTDLAPGDPLSTAGASFQGYDREVIDHYLEIGAKTHRHDDHPALADPLVAPTVGLSGTPGTIPSNVSITIGFTLIDGDGGETLISPSGEITMPAGISTPTTAPLGSADYSGGQLRADTYYYAKTWIDGAGGETPIGPRAAIVRVVGHASGQVQIAGLTTGMAAASAAGWRLYKSVAGSTWKFLAQGTDDAITDDGALCADCVTPPPTVNTTSQSNSLTVTVASAQASAAASFRLYGGVGGIADPSFLGEYPPGSAGVPLQFTSFLPSRGRPPRISTSVGGVGRIDPDTELIEWHWKRPVETYADLPAGEHGDVRMVLDVGHQYSVLGSAATGPADWTEVVGVLETAVSGSAIGRRDELNLIPRGATHILGADNSGATRVDLTIDGGLWIGPDAPPSGVRTDNFADLANWHATIGAIGSWSVSGGELHPPASVVAYKAIGYTPIAATGYIRARLRVRAEHQDVALVLRNPATGWAIAITPDMPYGNSRLEAFDFPTGGSAYYMEPETAHADYEYVELERNGTHVTWRGLDSGGNVVAEVTHAFASVFINEITMFGAPAALEAGILALNYGGTGIGPFEIEVPDPNAPSTYIWVQTGLGDGTDFEVWIETGDGT